MKQYFQRTIKNFNGLDAIWYFSMAYPCYVIKIITDTYAPKKKD
eukprot:CAMPEP_0114587032 /NCGR_PEP_ID=MMETSP0125-20121206/10103_1 /TAXON_ID=485358 ORGANISM="Aristerostoma sp., Strain ATCC 50986" /NCGR_SAMPLE_ID=MMETSP0125 /ASSEMBLY_ACC=CAM_ASM_000245 /LENGTH=43 /DNA_ID= /DNA_START= /DNA_END= /DNA_ORIENTATION=